MPKTVRLMSRYVGGEGSLRLQASVPIIHAGLLSWHVEGEFPSKGDVYP